jgi:hypothetical protein
MPRFGALGCDRNCRLTNHDTTQRSSCETAASTSRMIGKTLAAYCAAGRLACPFKPNAQPVSPPAPGRQTAANLLTRDEARNPAVRTSTRQIRDGGPRSAALVSKTPSVSKVVNRKKFKVTSNLLFGPSSLDFSIDIRVIGSSINAKARGDTLYCTGFDGFIDGCGRTQSRASKSIRCWQIVCLYLL